MPTYLGVEQFLTLADGVGRWRGSVIAKILQTSFMDGLLAIRMVWCNQSQVFSLLFLSGQFDAALKCFTVQNRFINDQRDMIFLDCMIQSTIVVK